MKIEAGISLKGETPALEAGDGQFDPGIPDRNVNLNRQKGPLEG